MNLTILSFIYFWGFVLDYWLAFNPIEFLRASFRTYLDTKNGNLILILKNFASYSYQRHDVEAFLSKKCP